VVGFTGGRRASKAGRAEGSPICACGGGVLGGGVWGGVLEGGGGRWGV